MKITSKTFSFPSVVRICARRWQYNHVCASVCRSGLISVGVHADEAIRFMTVPWRALFLLSSGMFKFWVMIV